MLADMFHFFLNIYSPRELSTLGAKKKINKINATLDDLEGPLRTVF